MTYLFKQCFRYVYDIHVACTASIQLLFMHSFLQLADNEGNTNVLSNHWSCRNVSPCWPQTNHSCASSCAWFRCQVCLLCCHQCPMDSTGAVATMQSAATASSVQSRTCGGCQSFVFCLGWCQAPCYTMDSCAWPSPWVCHLQCAGASRMSRSLGVVMFQAVPHLASL